MAAVRQKLSGLGRRRIAFSAVVIVFLALFGVLGWKILALAFVGWFENALGLMGDFEPAHRIHFMNDASVWILVVVGMLAQLRAPRKYAAASLMALSPFPVYFLVFGLTGFWKPAMMFGIFGGLVLLATVLQPAIRELLGSFSLQGASRVMLALVVVAAVPLMAFSATQFGLQTGAIEPAGHGHGDAAADHEKVHQQHIDHGHFAFMMAFGLIILLVSLLASFRPTGWVVPAVFAGLLPAYFGLLSLTFPDAASSAEPMWAAAGIGWGVAFVAAAVRSRAEERPSPYGEGTPAAVLED